jgi:hypothetical protein
MSILDQHWDMIRQWSCTPAELREQTLETIIRTDFEVSLIRTRLEEVLEELEDKFLDQPAMMHLDPELFSNMKTVVYRGMTKDTLVLCVLQRATIMHLMGTFLNSIDADRSVHSGVDRDVRAAAQAIINGVESETIDARKSSPVIYSTIWAAQKIGVCESAQLPEEPRFCS